MDNIILLDGKEYIAFSKNQRPLVKLGGKVYAITNAALLKEHQEYTVLRIHESLGEWFFDVEINGDRRERYVSRFGILAEGVKKEKKEMDVMICINPIGALVKGQRYQIVDKKDDLVKVKEHPRWLKASRFSSEDVEGLKHEEIEQDVGGNPGVCSYLVQFQDGTENKQYQDVCHARLFGQGYNNFKPIKAIYLNVSGHYKFLQEHDTYKEFVKYIIEESPWKDAFIRRPFDKVINSGVSLNLGRGKNYLISAAVALRVGSEYATKGFLREWWNLVEAGCSKNLAFIVASLVSSRDGGWYSIGYMQGSHHVFADYQDINQLASFFNDGVIHKEGDIPKSFGYEVLQCIAEDKRSDEHSLASFVKNNYKQIKKKNGMWGGITDVVEKHPVYGFAPLAFCLSKIFK